MENSMGMLHFFMNSDTIARVLLGLMAIASVGTWYLIVVKCLQEFRLKRRSSAFLNTFWAAPNLEAVAIRLRETGIQEPFSHLVHHGFTAIEQQNRKDKEGAALGSTGAPEEMLTRALKRAIEEDRSQLEFGQTFLATVASTAPFVGLFGTVWGIYHALIAIGRSGQSTLDKVAGPVGEALIMTGLGLAVAIPASIAYNHFARQNRRVLSQLNSFAYDVFAFLSTGVKTSPMLTDARISSEKVMAMARAQQHPRSEEAVLAARSPISSH